MAFEFQKPCRHFVALNGLTEGPCYLHPMNEAMFTRHPSSGALGSISCFFLIVLGLSSCQSPHPHQAAIDELQELQRSVSTAFAQLQELPTDSVLQCARWSSENLQELELLLSGGHIVITKAEGSIISEVSRARRLLKDHESRRNRLTQNTERTRLQLQLLADVIAQNAHIDGAGTPIDSGYIATQVLTEARIARELIEAINETIDLARRGVALVEEARADNDSLQTILRARLAQHILDSTDDSTPEDS